jgi:hypothetical protein
VLARTRSRAAVLALLIAIAAGYFLTRDDQTTRARESIDRVVAALEFDERREAWAARTERVARELEALATPDVTASIPEAPGLLRGRAALASFASNARDLHRLELGLSDVMASFDAGRRTVLFTMRVAVTAHSSGYERREVRNVSVQLVRHGDGWSISSLTVAPRTHEEPEARP